MFPWRYDNYDIDLYSVIKITLICTSQKRAELHFPEYLTMTPGSPPAYHTSTRAPLIPLQSRPRTWSKPKLSQIHNFATTTIIFHPPVLQGRHTGFGHSVLFVGPAPCLWGHSAVQNFFWRWGLTICKPQKTAPRRHSWWTVHTGSDPTLGKEEPEGELEPWLQEVLKC